MIPNCVAIDTETTGINPWRGDRMFSAAAAFPSGRRLFWYRDFAGLKDLLEDESVDKVFHNAKFDLRMLEFSGFTVKGKVWDTMIFGHLLDGRDAGSGLSLDNMSRKYLPMQYRKVTQEVNEFFQGIANAESKKLGKQAAKRNSDFNKSIVDFSKLPKDLLKRRVVGDADLTLRLFNRMYDTVRQTFPLLLDQEHKLLMVVKRMEDRGIQVDIEEIHRQKVEYDLIVDDVLDFFETYTGKEGFNLNSRADQERVLDMAGLLDCIDERTDPSKTFPNGQPKLNDYNLRNLHHPVAHMLLMGKAAAKMRDTFLSQAEGCQTDGVLHPNFNQLGTTTGRFSCSNPNLQNIPIEGDRRTAYTESEAEESFDMTGIEYAPHIKRLFVVRPGYAHIHSDKKQAEMVMLAHYTNSKSMREIFETGESIHDGLCRLLYGEWTKGLKTRTKAVVFGYQYGASLATIAKKIGSDLAEARRARNRLAQVIPDLPRWRRLLEDLVQEQGFVQTIHGRRHYLSGSESYKAVNRMCQGSVGDEIKSRMVALDDMIRAEGVDACLLLNIHDDIGTEIAEGDVERIGPKIVDIMNESTPLGFTLPLAADANITFSRWADLMDVEDEKDPRSYSKEAWLKAFVAKNERMPDRNV